MTMRRDMILNAVCLTAALAVAGGASVAATLGPARAEAGEPLLVIAPPWGQGAAALVKAAGGTLLGPVDAPFAVLARFDTVEAAVRLLDNGAWAVRDGRIVASICGVKT